MVWIFYLSGRLHKEALWHPSYFQYTTGFKIADFTIFESFKYCNF